MLLAYLDEFGHVGPYVSPKHPKYKTHPAFGYAGFVVPSSNVRAFGGFFEHIKESLLKFEIDRDGEHPRRWEKKGASLLTTKNVLRYPDLTNSIHRLLTRLIELDGRVIYYGQLKPAGSEKETGESSSERNAHHLRQILIRLGSYANQEESDVLVVLDSTDDKPRLAAVEQWPASSMQRLHHLRFEESSRYPCRSRAICTALFNSPTGSAPSSEG